MLSCEKKNSERQKNLDGYIDWMYNINIACKMQSKLKWIKIKLIN